MKKKLYCYIGSFALVFPLIFFYTGENHTESEKAVSGVFRELSKERLISCEMQKENEAEPVIAYTGSERAPVLDYISLKEGQGGEYSSDLLLNIKESADKKNAKEKNSNIDGIKEKNTNEESTKKKNTKDESSKKKNAKDGSSKKDNAKDESPENRKKNKKNTDKKNKSSKNRDVISLTKEEKEILLRIVEAEATGEDIVGRMLVANVVLNRVKSDIFPDNVKDVVYANSNGIYQFSPIRDGRFWQVSISSETRKAVRRVLKGEDYSEGALFFMARRSARSSNVNWFETHLTMVKQYGGHEFYK